MNKWIPLMLVPLLCLCSCNRQQANQPLLRLGFVPFESSHELLKDVQPLIEVIEKGMQMEVQPIIASDYAGVVEAFKSGSLDAAFMSPASYVMAHKEAGAHVILKSQRRGNANYYGAIITRSDSPIKTLQDLKGKRFSFGDPLSTSGHVFPRKILQKAGVNPATDFDKVLYSGSHDSTILAVLHKKVDAGATYADDTEGKSNAWSRFLNPEEQKQIRVLAYSEAIPADNICVSKDFPAAKVQQLQQTILDYSASAEGQHLMRRLYHFDGYVKASDADYESVREAFEQAGIPLKEKLKQK